MWWSNVVAFQVVAGFCAIATALVGGVFLAFSDFLMCSLEQMDNGSETMKVINIKVFSLVFMPLFLWIVPISLVLAGLGLFILSHRPMKWLLFAGSLAYVSGVFLVTGAGNVPMNNRLADLKPGPDTEDYWRSTYLPKWTLLNTVRTVACVASSSCFLLAVAVAPRNDPVRRPAATHAEAPATAASHLISK
ncbi:hypothetical protein CTAYLR_001333 [Chrysophaeum taylorii]|uniref:DUF1772 domain-containing protein n=1 Tax=Chrysophaeum taylorii TaxID=2483200 RepID=A0AAD7XGK3_9STRA|nr:hypothetical protein CTAYLR_001333 [Chrysophaeum taylorii]